MPPPPPLSLEHIVTEDSFQPTPVPHTAKTPPPPPLSLEHIVTADPFQPTPTALHSLPMTSDRLDDHISGTVNQQHTCLQVQLSEKLQLQRAYTEPKKPKTIEVLVPEDLSLQRACTEPMHRLTEMFLAEVGPMKTAPPDAPPGLAPPPQLSLDHVIVTDDPFRPTPKAAMMKSFATPLGAPPATLALEHIVTDDSLQPTPQAARQPFRPCLGAALGGSGDLAVDSSPLSSPAITWTVEAKNTFVHVQETLTVTWMPGRLGIKFRNDNGLVEEVYDGGQAQRTGVKVGMYFQTLDDVKYTHRLVDEKIDGGKPYKVVFELPRAVDVVALERARTDPAPAPTAGRLFEHKFQAAAATGMVAPPQLALEEIVTDECFGPMPQTSTLSVSPDQATLPQLQLEFVATDDQFESTSAPRPTPTAGQLAYVQSAAPKLLMCPPPPPLAPAPLIEAMPPTRPPTMPAPIMDMPGAPEAPQAPPSRTPGASTAALSETELCKPGVMLRTGASGDCTHVHWTVDARKLQRQDKQAVSPKFMVDLPGQGPTPFKILLYAKEGTVSGKKGSGFVKVKGCGQVVLKCEAQLPESCSQIAFRIGVGRGAAMQPFRGPAIENFFEQSCQGLPTADEEWDFSASVEATNTFMVTLEIAPKQSLLAMPGLWWAPLDSSE